MTRKTRRFIFYGLVLVFFFITPPTILYAVGYSFDWQNLAIKETGALFLSSQPAEAQIFLNGQSRKITPRLLAHLLPGNYQLTVSQEGFHSWQKNLEVQAGLVTEARNIFLFPNEPEIKLLATNVTSTPEFFLSDASTRKNQQQAQNIASTTAGWLLKNDQIFYLEKNTGFLWRTDLSGSIKEQLTNDALPRQNYSIKTVFGNRFLAQGQDGQLFYLQRGDSWKKIADQITSTDFSTDEKKILWVNGKEIWVRWLDDALIQPYRSAGDQELIARFSLPITQAFFYPTNEHVSFTISGQIKIAELDGRDRRNIVDLFTAENPEIFLNPQNGSLCFKQQNDFYCFLLEK